MIWLCIHFVCFCFQTVVRFPRKIDSYSIHQTVVFAMLS